MVIRFLTILFFIQTYVLAQGVNPLQIPDTLIGPFFNLSIDESTRQFFPGPLTQTKAFNGNSFLGPTLIIRRGWNVEVTVNNQLADTTTIHWHGLHVSAHTDGGPHSPILPQQQWNPDFTCLDKASTYWYHPHFHGKTAKHTLEGAAGIIIVRDVEESNLNLPRKYGVDDFPVIVQSLEFGPDNQIKTSGLQDSIVLVNGILKPFLQVPAQKVRLRLLNASNARNFNIGLPGNAGFFLIGTDGGLLGRPLPVTRVKLAPGERAEVVVDFTGQQGSSISLKSYGSEIPVGTQGGPLPLMPAGTPPMDSPLNGVDFEVLELRVGAMTSNPSGNLPDSLAAQTRIPESLATDERNLRFTPVVPGSYGGPFLLNDSTFKMERIDLRIPLNAVEIWNIHNQTPVAHPFHLHGFSFYILDRYGALVGPEEQGRRDMVLVYPNEQIRIISRFSNFADSTTPFMYHCHLLTHEDEGMMGQFVVMPLVSSQNQINQSDFSVFPNPFSESIDIQNSDYPEGFSVFNNMGKLVFSSDSKTESIETKIWPSGIYWMISSKGKRQKLIKFQ